MNTVFLMLGSNVGDRPVILRQAREKISRCIGIIERSSALYETEPWGFSHPDKFLNQCLRVRSDLGPEKILAIIAEIEESMGRKRGRGDYQARIIDVDILFYNDRIIDTDELVIPHPLISQRRFVLLPLSEIAPQLIHPVSGMSVNDMLYACDDKLSVEKIS